MSLKLPQSSDVNRPNIEPPACHHILPQHPKLLPNHIMHLLDMHVTCHRSDLSQGPASL
jgi:hypothetical protein